MNDYFSRYFRNYMNEHLLKAGAQMVNEGNELARIPSLKTYFRTKSAIVLHLTNGTLQVKRNNFVLLIVFNQFFSLDKLL